MNFYHRRVLAEQHNYCPSTDSHKKGHNHSCYPAPQSSPSPRTGVREFSVIDSALYSIAHNSTSVIDRLELLFAPSVAATNVWMKSFRELAKGRFYFCFVRFRSDA